VLQGSRTPARSARLSVLLLAAGVLAAAAQAPQGFLGVGLQDVPGTQGAVVGVLAPGGPAQAAGLRVGDVIVAVGGAPAADTATVVRAVGALSAGQTAELSVLRAGRALTVRAVVAPPPGSGARAPAAAAAVGSTAHATAQGSPPAVQALKVARYTSFTDPEEHAFSMEVPEGWHTVGALARHGVVQISPFVRTLAPDRMTYLMVGEPTLLSYAPPTAVTQKLGYREGTLHNAGAGGVTMILRYIPGAQFARLYGQTALGALCAQLHFVSAAERADFVAAADQLIPTVIPSSSSGGEASFTCRHGGQEMAARVDAVTRVTRDNQLWNVIFLRALLTPKSESDAAFEILKHMTVTFRYDPAWVQQQNAASAQASAAINARAQASLREERAVIEKLNASDESFDSVDDIVSGYSTYRDEQTGNTYKLSSTNPGKWMTDSGRILSTPDNNPPPWAANVHALTRVD